MRAQFRPVIKRYVVTCASCTVLSFPSLSPLPGMRGVAGDGGGVGDALCHGVG